MKPSWLMQLRAGKKQPTFDKHTLQQVPGREAAEVLTMQDVCIAAGKTTLVRNLNISLKRGSCLTLIGESGSGKSLTGLSIAGLLPRGVQLQQGRILLEETEIHECSDQMLRHLRGRRVAYVFQNYAGMFSPLLPIGKQLDETLKAHLDCSHQERQRTIHLLLEQLGLPAERVQSSYTFQLSGGQLQRVAIAAAFMLKPQLIIADEPTTALDPATGISILELLLTLKQQTGCSILLITHDLRIARAYADHVAVMRHGQIVESGSTMDILDHPVHEYTRRLIEAERVLHSQVVPTLHIKADTSLLADPCDEEGVPLLSIEKLTKSYSSGDCVLRDITLNIQEGECVGLIGESGSGKSTLARCMLLLEQADEGTVKFRNQPIQKLSLTGRKQLHGQIQAVFQNPTSSLNPRLRILDSVMEPLNALPRSHEERANYRMNKRHIAERLLQKVGLPADLLDRFPEQLSGGQKQRISIARAISVEPAFIVFDEPTASLDMVVQAQILLLLKGLQQQLGFGILFISHDLRAVQYMSDRILTLKGGQLYKASVSEIEKE
ncbi:Glutathione import ATP-binding protein GsiA [compost metagenome]